MKIILGVSDRDLLSSCEKLLTLEGFEVQTAFDGTRVATLAPAEPFDAAVLEDALPRIGSPALTGQLHHLGIPVIVLLNQRVTVSHLLRSPLPDAYLSHPFLPEDLFRVLREAAEKPAAPEAIPLTCGEIRLLKLLDSGAPVSGKAARTMITALNEKWKNAGLPDRITYEISKGYRRVKDHD